MTKETRKRTAETPGSLPEGEGRNPDQYGNGVSNVTAMIENSHPESMNLMEVVVEKENMWKSYRKVVGNKGAAGVDKMTVEELKDKVKLNEHHAQIAQEQFRYEALETDDEPLDRQEMRVRVQYAFDTVQAVLRLTESGQ